MLIDLALIPLTSIMIICSAVMLRLEHDEKLKKDLEDENARNHLKYH